MKVLLADDFPLPPAIVTESVGIFGRKGSGKTVTGGRLFEQMFGIGAQCVALDPVGNWWGLRLSASGKRAGLKIPIFGGDRGDIPISPGGGKLMAQTVVERNISCVIDLMNFRPSQRKEFSADFAEELFELKKRKRTPLHLFVEEARLFAPQVMKAKVDVRMGEAFEQIVRLGRNYGLGVSLIDQRPQSVNKEVTSQTEVLIAHQMVENQGREAIERWVRSKKTVGADQLEHLDELKCGEAFVWSPGLLRKFARIRVGMKWTYDSSGTPELGKATVAATRPLSSKDLEVLKAAMADVVKQAEASDPSKLQAEVRRLRIELERAKSTQVVGGPTKTVEKTVEKIVEKIVTDPKLVKQSMDLETQVAKALAPIGDQVTKAVQLLARFTTDLAKRPPASSPATRAVPKSTAIATAVKEVAKPRTPARATGTVLASEIEVLTGPEMRILNALAWLESLNTGEDPSTEAVAFVAGYRPKGGAFGNPKSHLNVMGLIEYTGGGRLRRTEEGCRVAPTPPTPPTASDLHAAVMGRLTGPEQRILEPLLKSYPEGMAIDDLAAAAGYAPTGGAFGNPKSRLRTLGIVDYPTKNVVRANDFLFP